MRVYKMLTRKVVLMDCSYLLLMHLLLLLLLPLSSGQIISYHNGPLLTGNISLAILWYGQFSPLQKHLINTFVASLNDHHNVSYVPRVSDWWNKVETYQVVAADKRSHVPPTINVKVATEVDDFKHSVGKVLSGGYHAALVKKATGGMPNSVAVIFTAKDVKVEDSCSNSAACYVHGVIEKQMYIVAGNPIEECLKKCTWPFVTGADEDDDGLSLRMPPPNKDVGADAMIVHFAAALAATVTNPYSNGFFGGEDKELEVGSACMGVFGSGAFPGYAGRIRICPSTGAGFNAHGLNSTRFLLPAVWDPNNSSCWTTL